MPKIPVSCFLIAKNEADRIVRTIRSVNSFVDEVVVVDSQSSDDTVGMAQEEGCRVIVQPWLGFGAQKRFAEDQCRNDWVLNLDADEVVTLALQQEIIALFNDNSPSFVCYGMPRHIVYPGADKSRPFARDHWYVRLYNRRIVRFRDSPIHDTVVTDGHKVGRLNGALLHYSMRSFEDMKLKLDERMWLLASYGKRPSARILIARLFTELPMHFFKYYFVRRHITGGLTGLRYAFIQARYRHLKIRRMWRFRKHQ